MKKNFIIDTCIFINPDVRHFFGNTPSESMNNFLLLLEKNNDVRIIIPETVYDEIMNFINKEEIDLKLLKLLIKKSPDKYNTNVPAIFLYFIVKDIRKRVDKGLRISERIIREALSQTTDDRGLIKKLRLQYRQALREGIIDSTADLDIIMLCLENNACLVTADEGLNIWASNFGIEKKTVEEFYHILKK